MSIDNSLWAYFAHADIVVKLVLLILFAASVLSWTLIIHRAFYLKKIQAKQKRFLEAFYSGIDYNKLYDNVSQRADEENGMQTMFKHGFQEFKKNANSVNHSKESITQRVQRSMQLVEAKIIAQLEQNLSILATIGSTSPYIGLFGTVWGIMTVFHSLGSVQQASIAMVAPGISEALIATAMGLFAAIPAVIAYNRFQDRIDSMENAYENFNAEFTHNLPNLVNE